MFKRGAGGKQFKYGFKIVANAVASVPISYKGNPATRNERDKGDEIFHQRNSSCVVDSRGIPSQKGKVQAGDWDASQKVIEAHNFETTGSSNCSE